MAKLLITLVIVVLALLWWFGKGRGGGAAGPRGGANPPPRPRAMVACAHCGLHLPQSDALEGESGRHYCCAEHRRLGP